MLAASLALGCLMLFSYVKRQEQQGGVMPVLQEGLVE
jgi:SET family sugar efflux transporter-like MFS transporter